MDAIFVFSVIITICAIGIVYINTPQGKKWLAEADKE